MVAFLFFILSGICFGLIILVQTQIKISKYRKYSLLIEYAAENGAKRGFHQLYSLVSGKPGLTSIDDSFLAGLREEPDLALSLLVDSLNDSGIPLETKESEGDFEWRSATLFSLRNIEDYQAYLRITADFDIQAKGKMASLPQEKEAVLSGYIEFLAGRIPLSSIPLAIRKTMTDSELTGFMAENRIAVLDQPEQTAGPRPVAASEGILPADASGLLAQALGIKLFRPQDISPAKLRELLGLEPSTEPLPEGIYPIADDIGFNGLFVQGDIDELIPAIDGEDQVVLFRMESDEWLLRFSPSSGWSELAGPGGTETFESVFGGFIIVNGDISSFGGGYVTPDGKIKKAEDQDIPSILNGARLTIICSEKVEISSHLILQGVQWKDGFPYLKSSQSQLVIFSTGTDIVTGEKRDSVISVSGDGDRPAEIKIQASITAVNGIFEIKGTDQQVQIAGGLHVSEFIGNGNSLAIAADSRLSPVGPEMGVPLTDSGFLTVFAFRPTCWKEQ